MATHFPVGTGTFLFTDIEGSMRLSATCFLSMFHSAISAMSYQAVSCALADDGGEVQSLYGRSG